MKSCLSVHCSFCEAGLNETNYILVATSHRMPAAKLYLRSADKEKRNFTQLWRDERMYLFFGYLNLFENIDSFY